MASANQDAALGSGVPALVITQVEEPEASPAVKTEVQTVDPEKPQCPGGLVPSSAAPLPQDLSPSPSGDGDMSCSDLVSLRSDSVSFAGSRRSEESQEEDARSVTASSVMSMFQRVQLDPLEKDWMKSCALGNTAVQRQLLVQEPGLVLKKTALHWAVKHGRQDAVDLMIRSGADVNARSGYTALHLSSIHEHRHLVLALINIYNAKTNIRDYHGKTAAHYWKGSTDIFNKPVAQTDRVFPQRRRTQRYTLPSSLLSRSRSQGHIRLEFSLPHSASHDGMELQL